MGRHPLEAQVLEPWESSSTMQRFSRSVLKRTVALASTIGIAIGAQLALGNGALGLGLAAFLLAISLGLLFLPRLERPPLDQQPVLPRTGPWRRPLAAFALAAGATTFILSGGNRYQLANVLPWLISLLCWWLAHADLRLPQPIGNWRPSRQQLLGTSLFIAMLVLGAIFRYALLFDNPREMNSDQAEKLLDVGDLLNGQYAIFFERNTGREPWQFYWTLALIRLFGLGPDFMALKIGTSLIGWLMLPAIFLLAHEIFGLRTALLALLFGAVASWGVITARFGLRYPLAPCAVAWTLFFLVRGLRRGERNAMLAAGLWLGIGLQGYTAYRFMIVVVPLLSLIWMGWLLWQRQAALARRTLVSGLIALIMTLLVLMPLLRYGFDQPDQLFYRSATRLTGVEQPIDGSPPLIFLDNLRRVLLMFNLTHDNVWVANLNDRPALDPLLGALLVLGTGLALGLSLRSGNPWPALLLLSAVLMLIPSALSIAFPRENPSVVRTGGAMPAVLILCALGPGLLLESARQLARPWLRGAALVGVIALALTIGLINRERVFTIYPAQYCSRAQNASDIAYELQRFIAQGGARQQAWLIGFPHWVDTRAVGVWLGDSSFSNTVLGADAAIQINLGGQPGWFALNIDDLVTLRALQARYPSGTATTFKGSLCDGREFIVFTVP